jgi:hypothetical protein
MEGDLKAGKLLDDIDRNAPVIFRIGKKAYKMKRITNYVHGKFSRLVTKAELSYSDDKKTLLVNMEKNRKLVPKCLSLIILHHPIKVMLFYSIHWRYLNLFFTMDEMALAFNQIKDNMDVSSLFFCLSYLQANNKLQVMMAKENTSSIAAKLNSAGEPTQ